MIILDPAAPTAPTTLHVCTVPGLPASVRIVSTPTSTLTIGAAPWRHARRLAALPLFSGACLYVLTGSEARIGKTTGLDARLRDHRRAMPMPRIDQIFAIASPDFNSDAITTLEATLTQAVRKAGVMPVVGAPLRVPALDPARDRDLLHWLGEMPRQTRCSISSPATGPLPMPSIRNSPGSWSPPGASSPGTGLLSNGSPTRW